MQQRATTTGKRESELHTTDNCGVRVKVATVLGIGGIGTSRSLRLLYEPKVLPLRSPVCSRKFSLKTYLALRRSDIWKATGNSPYVIHKLLPKVN
jgi:hypothetical protein